MSNNEKLRNAWLLIKSPKEWNMRKIGAWTGSAVVLGGIAGAMFGGLAVTGTTSSTYGTPSEIAFMPNTSNLNDMSFNYETHKGVQDYNRYFEVDSKVYTPPSMAPTVTEYQTTLDKAAAEHKGVLTNGFMPIDALLGTIIDPNAWPPDRNADGWLFQNPNKYAIVLDDAGLNGTTTVNGVTTEIDNGISVTYRANEAAFFAGMAAALYATFDGDADQTVSLWGGMQFNNVYDWLSGYEQGVNYFNYAILGYDTTGSTSSADANTVDTINELGADEEGNINQLESINLQSKVDGIEPVQIVTPGTGVKGSVDAGQVVSYTEESSSTYGVEDFGVAYETWYTGSFDPGDGESAAQSSKGVDVLFPVAGPQTADALNVGDSMVIGVDTDISNVYTDETFQDKILGSATKNLSYGATFTMWYAERWEGDFLINDVTGEYNTDEEAYQELARKGNEVDWAMYMKHIDGRTYNDDGTVNASSTSWLTSDDYLNVDKAGDDFKEGTEDPVDQENPEDMFEHDYFVGTYENGGVGYTTNGSETQGVDVMWETLMTTIGDDSGTTFEEFMAIAFENQKYDLDGDGEKELYIEISSPTFVGNLGATAPRTALTYEVLPWYMPASYAVA